MKVLLQVINYWEHCIRYCHLNGKVILQIYDQPLEKEFFDIENTRLTYTNEEGVLTTRINPLPLLMAFPGSPYDRMKQK